ncbi:MAG: secretin N-terminal domain-containing protein, partial [Planctomycetaceae bacterium]
DAEVASVLRQLNARNSAPLLTIEVQQETNSLVVKAPQTLIEELQELVARLDESARSTRAEGIRMIPLQKVNSQRVMEILGDVLNR